MNPNILTQNLENPDVVHLAWTVIFSSVIVWPDIGELKP